MPSTEEEFDDLKDLTGRVIAGRYKLNRFISAGGFGAVYEATDDKFPERPVAVKLCIQISSESTFLREARLLGKLNHDNIVRVVDQGVHKGIPYIVMDLLKGVSVTQLLDRFGGRMPKSLLQQFVSDIGRALAHAHKNHLVHRDITPNNLLLVGIDEAESATSFEKMDFERGDLKFVLIDFGLAAKTDANDSLANRSLNGGGTPEYMAPEQVTSLEPSAQTDIYSFGVLLFQMLTGKLPFPLQGESYADIAGVMTAIVEESPPQPSDVAHQDTIPPGIDKLVMTCLAKKPSDRPDSIEQVVREFISILASTVTLSTSPSPINKTQQMYTPKWRNPFANRPRRPVAPGEKDAVKAAIKATVVTFTMLVLLSIILYLLYYSGTLWWQKSTALQARSSYMARLNDITDSCGRPISLSEVDDDLMKSADKEARDGEATLNEQSFRAAIAHFKAATALLSEVRTDGPSVLSALNYAWTHDPDIDERLTALWAMSQQTALPAELVSRLSEVTLDRAETNPAIAYLICRLLARHASNEQYQDWKSRMSGSNQPKEIKDLVGRARTWHREIIEDSLRSENLRQEMLTFTSLIADRDVVIAFPVEQSDNATEWFQFNNALRSIFGTILLDMDAMTNSSDWRLNRWHEGLVGLSNFPTFPRMPENCEQRFEEIKKESDYYRNHWDEIDRYLNSNNPTTQKNALLGLGVIAPIGMDAIPKLVGMLGNEAEEGDVRAYAAWALGKWVTDAATANSELVRGALLGDKVLRHECLVALGLINRMSEAGESERIASLRVTPCTGTVEH